MSKLLRDGSAQQFDWLPEPAEEKSGPKKPKKS